ncbi:MAG: undecaprenyl/decaprenyl-phosphate alpha-N-acetylglucosaminyl 1-phosphate transferase [Anaerolineae bacterium]|nr:undecaprenyl/decaprenyl-phosphate alpha-N-acetylglucosaminyl 1-phosphate transferase [Anaerolineae bacterium]
MSKFIPIILASGLISFVATPLVGKLAKAINFVDKPEARKVHVTPVPMLGGVAIYAGLIAAVTISNAAPLRELVGVLSGATIMTLFGLFDDRYGMRPIVKMLGQLLAGVILIWSGIQVSLFPWQALNIALTLCWIIGICNAINFLDNMDGLAAGITTVASAFFFILALVEGLGLVASLAAATLGACIGFLYYNFNPASLFMGDAGSMLLGFVLAVLGIKLQFADAPLNVTWMIPVIILGLPIFDTTLVVFSRLRRSKPIYQGGKDHTSHRFVTVFGMTQARSVITLYLIATVLGLIGLMLRDATPLQARLILAVLSAIFGGALVWLEWRFQEPASSKVDG